MKLSLLASIVELVHYVQYIRTDIHNQFHSF